MISCDDCMHGHTFSDSPYAAPYITADSYHFRPLSPPHHRHQNARPHRTAQYDYHPRVRMGGRHCHGDDYDDYTDVGQHGMTMGRRQRNHYECDLGRLQHHSHPRPHSHHPLHPHYPRDPSPVSVQRRVEQVPCLEEPWRSQLTSDTTGGTTAATTTAGATVWTSITDAAQLVACVAALTTTIDDYPNTYVKTNWLDDPSFETTPWDRRPGIVLVRATSSRMMRMAGLLIVDASRMGVPIERQNALIGDKFYEYTTLPTPSEYTLRGGMHAGLARDGVGAAGWGHSVASSGSSGTFAQGPPSTKWWATEDPFAHPDMCYVHQLGPEALVATVVRVIGTAACDALRVTVSGLTVGGDTAATGTVGTDIDVRHITAPLLIRVHHVRPDSDQAIAGFRVVEKKSAMCEQRRHP